MNYMKKKYSKAETMNEIPGKYCTIEDDYLPTQESQQSTISYCQVHRRTTIGKTIPNATTGQNLRFNSDYETQNTVMPKNSYTIDYDHSLELMNFQMNREVLAHKIQRLSQLLVPKTTTNSYSKNFSFINNVKTNSLRLSNLTNNYQKNSAFSTNVEPLPGKINNNNIQEIENDFGRKISSTRQKINQFLREYDRTWSTDVIEESKEENNAKEKYIKIAGTEPSTSYICQELLSENVDNFNINGSNSVRNIQEKTIPGILQFNNNERGEDRQLKENNYKSENSSINLSEIADNLADIIEDTAEMPVQSLSNNLKQVQVGATNEVHNQTQTYQPQINTVVNCDSSAHVQNRLIADLKSEIFTTLFDKSKEMSIPSSRRTYPHLSIEIPIDNILQKELDISNKEVAINTNTSKGNLYMVSPRNFDQKIANIDTPVHDLPQIQPSTAIKPKRKETPDKEVHAEVSFAKAEKEGQLSDNNERNLNLEKENNNCVKNAEIGAMKRIDTFFCEAIEEKEKERACEKPEGKFEKIDIDNQSGGDNKIYEKKESRHEEDKKILNGNYEDDNEYQEYENEEPEGNIEKEDEVGQEGNDEEGGDEVGQEDNDEEGVENNEGHEELEEEEENKEDNVNEFADDNEDNENEYDENNEDNQNEYEDNNEGNDEEEASNENENDEKIAENENEKNNSRSGSQSVQSNSIEDVASIQRPISPKCKTKTDRTPTQKPATSHMIEEEDYPHLNQNPDTNPNMENGTISKQLQEDQTIKLLPTRSSLNNSNDSMKHIRGLNNNNHLPRKSRSNKKVTFADENKIIISYKENALIQHLTIIRENGSKSKIPRRNHKNYLKLLKSKVKPKPIIVKSAKDEKALALEKLQNLINECEEDNNNSEDSSEKKLRSQSCQASSPRGCLSMGKSNNPIIERNIKMIQDIQTRKKNRHATRLKRVPTPRKPKIIDLCKRFKSNPGKFFTENLCEIVLKSYNLQNMKYSDSNETESSVFVSPIRVNSFKFDESKRKRNGNEASSSPTGKPRTNLKEIFDKVDIHSASDSEDSPSIDLSRGRKMSA